YGGRVACAPRPVHGKTSRVRHDRRGLFRDVPDPAVVGRYHSLVVTDLPPELEACAWAEDGCLMAFRHRSLPVAGVQFHPDSFLTPDGERLFRNALDGRF
ncbi:MAG TPA: gamma-glutamyl-gamma-aminobutyrate hydrolase family protein, partial [Holophagaceae bacterium]